MRNLEEFAKTMVDTTSEHVFIRPEDRLLILRPNLVHHLNGTASEILHLLYHRENGDVVPVVNHFIKKYGKTEEEVKEDIYQLLKTLQALLKKDYRSATRIRNTPFASHKIKYPVISEIALTYSCQNSCIFCYASSPKRIDVKKPMTPAEVKIVIDKIWNQAKVPTLSFTGGEPTLIKELPEYIKHSAFLGLRTNLITNGIRCAEREYVALLKDSGLKSAQVSVESHIPELHDRIVGNRGAFEKTFAGLKNLKEAGIYTHSNTTISTENLDTLNGLLEFIADLGMSYLSLNMVIRTGTSLHNKDIMVEYNHISEILPALKEKADSLGIRLVWYSPTPYCLFNPVKFGLGSKSCAAADGLLSVNPEGDVLPCSSFQEGLGSLVKNDFDKIWNTVNARYWREKKFLPPGCDACELNKICCGACPLYWDEKKSFNEIKNFTGKIHPWQVWLWKLKRDFIGKCRGVKAG